MFQDSKPTTDKASKLEQNTKFTDENKEEGADESEELKMSGYRVPLVKNEPLKEYLLRIMESVNDVRVQHEKYHKENDDKTGMLLIKKLKNKTKIYEKNFWTSKLRMGCNSIIATIFANHTRAKYKMKDWFQQLWKFFEIFELIVDQNDGFHHDSKNLWYLVFSNKFQYLLNEYLV